MIIATTADRITTSRIARPEQKHPLPVAMCEQLTAALLAADGDPVVRAVVLTGATDYFSAGTDLSELARSTHGGAMEAFQAFLARYPTDVPRIRS